MPLASFPASNLPSVLPPRYFALLVFSSAYPIASLHGQDRPLPRNLSGDWLQYSEAHTGRYHSPGWQRLLFSIRPWGEVGSSNGKLKLESTQATITAEFLDNDRFSFSKIIPQAYGIGLSGNFSF